MTTFPGTYLIAVTGNFGFLAPVLCSAVWLYLGLVAALVLPRHPGSWDRIGGAVAFLVGVGFSVAAWRGSEREITDSPRRALP